jgi:hypothetical protein
MGLGRITFILGCYHFVYRIFQPKGIILINSQGSKLYVDTKDEGIAPQLIFTKEYEPTETDLFKSLLKKNIAQSHFIKVKKS